MRRVIPRTAVFAIVPMRYQHAATAAESDESGVPRSGKRSSSSSASAAKETFSASALRSKFDSWSTSARMAAVGAAVFVGYFGIKKLYAATVPTQAAFPASTRAVRDNRDGNNTTAALNSMTPQTSAPFGINKPEGPTRKEAAHTNTKNTNPRDGSRDSGFNKTVGESPATAYDKADASTTAIKNNNSGFFSFGKNKDEAAAKPSDYLSSETRNKVGYFNQNPHKAPESPVTTGGKEAVDKASSLLTASKKENERSQWGSGLRADSAVPTSANTAGRAETKPNSEHQKTDEGKKGFSVIPSDKEKAPDRNQFTAKDGHTNPGRGADKSDK